jgi:hypothetical protein
MKEGQQMYRESGMTCSAVILSNSYTSLHFRRIARESGIIDGEKYINSSIDPAWEEKGMKWISEMNSKQYKPQ